MSASKWILIAEDNANDVAMTPAGAVTRFVRAVKQPACFRAVLHEPPPGCARRP